ncbi:MAG TPA: adenylate/guanylate cyclase domain-containing protein, partial [Casimicrobiaceae bacterium]|nr:adenylate/guanylate cyclase domain-containing protein [Casimicrobiaceae bacterium]
MTTAAECVQCRAALPAGARFCPSCGAPVTDRASAQAPAGERRQVAILFADLAGYTRMSSDLDAEEVHRILTRYFELADAAIERAGGTIDKHVGDAVMGVFGAPIAHGNDIERALRAALDIHAGMAAIAADVGRPLAAHIGVASGEVVAATTGSDAHRAYTVTGDAVNLAARLTDVAKAGETAISDDVHRAAAALADVEALGDVAIRGLGAPQRVWKLLALRTAAAARVPLVGRDRERRRFAALLTDAATSRRGAIVLVAAEPGMGKTRLAEAFMATALAEGAYGHAATVLDFGAGQGEDAVYALACSLLDIPPHASGAVRREALMHGIAQARADSASEPYLADLVVVPQLAGGVYDAMDNAARLQGKRQALA